MTHNMALCAIPLPRCHGVCSPPSPAALRLPAWWQSPRQLAGILHANPPLRRFSHWAGSAESGWTQSQHGHSVKVMKQQHPSESRYYDRANS